MRRLLLLASAMIFFDVAFFAAIAPLLPEYVDDLGLSKAQAGVLSASYAAGTLIVGTAVGLGLAVILNQALPGRTLFRSVLLIPYLTSVSIVGLLWRNILDPQVGILNRLLESLERVAAGAAAVV